MNSIDNILAQSLGSPLKYLKTKFYNHLLQTIYAII